MICKQCHKDEIPALGTFLKEEFICLYCQFDSVEVMQEYKRQNTSEIKPYVLRLYVKHLSASLHNSLAPMSEA